MPFVFWPGVTSRLLLIGMVFVRKPTGFLLIMSLYYLISIVSGPAYASIMRSNYSDANRGRLMGNIRIIRMIAGAICAFGAGLILQAHEGSYRWLFPAAGCIGVVGSLFFRRIKVRHERQARARGSFSFLDALRTIRRDRYFLIFMALFFLCSGPNKLVIPLEPIRLVDDLKIDYGSAGLILGSMVFLCSILGFRLWGKLTSRTNPFLLLLVLFFISSLQLPIIALAQNQYHLIPASAVRGVSTAGYELLALFAIIRFARERNLALYIGFHTTMIGVRGILGPFAGIWLHKGLGLSIVQVFWIAFVLAVLGAAAMAVFVLRFLPHQKAIWSDDDTSPGSRTRR